MNKMADYVRQEAPWTRMFANDHIICRQKVEENPERYRFPLERRGTKISRSKTEYMCVRVR